MKGYEIICILHPDLTEEQVQGAIDQLTQVVAGNEGQLVKSENWGARKLAYKVAKQTRGIMLYLLFTGNRKTVDELERNIRNNESALRYMTVKVDSVEDAATVKAALLDDPVTGLAAEY